MSRSKRKRRRCKKKLKKNNQQLSRNVEVCGDREEPESVKFSSQGALNVDKPAQSSVEKCSVMNVDVTESIAEETTQQSQSRKREREDSEDNCRDNVGTDVNIVMSTLPSSDEQEGRRNYYETNRVQHTNQELGFYSTEGCRPNEVDEGRPGLAMEVSTEANLSSLGIQRIECQQTDDNGEKPLLEKEVKGLDDSVKEDTIHVVQVKEHVVQVKEKQQPFDPKGVSVSVVGEVNTNSSHISPKRTLVSTSRRKLLILDVNGVLADIISPPPKDQKADVNILRRAIFKRPFFYDFLCFCFEKFNVGIWSSRSRVVLDQVVDYLLGDLKNKLLFLWDTSHCTQSKFKTLENRYKPIVFKELRNLWEKSDPNLPWEKGDYDESNTLLLDDSPYKALLNPIHTAIFPNPYSFKDKSDNLLGPGGELLVYLEDLSTADNVKLYIEKNPFGQRKIDESSPFWPFYSQVLLHHYRSIRRSPFLRPPYFSAPK